MFFQLQLMSKYRNEIKAKIFQCSSLQLRELANLRQEGRRRSFGMKPDPIRGPTVRTYRLIWNKIFFNLAFANDFKVFHFLRVSFNIETLDLGKSLCFVYFL